MRTAPVALRYLEDGVALVGAPEACDFTFRFRTVVGSGHKTA